MHHLQQANCRSPPRLLNTLTCRKVPPPGDPLLIHVNKVDIPDAPPSDGELWIFVWGLQNGCVAGVSRLQPKHIKVWLRNVVHEEEEESDAGLGDKWRIFVH